MSFLGKFWDYAFNGDAPVWKRAGVLVGLTFIWIALGMVAVAALFAFIYAVASLFGVANAAPAVVGFVIALYLMALVVLS